MVIYVVVDEPNVVNQADSTYAQKLYQQIATEILPYMNIYPTEEVSDEVLAQLGLTYEDLGVENVHVFGAMDSWGYYHSDARVVDGQVVDGTGAAIAGAYIDENGNVIDGYANVVSSVEAEQVLDPKVDNPDMALPPTESDDSAENTALWDATALDEDTE